MKNERGILMFELLQLKDRRRIERRGELKRKRKCRTHRVCVLFKAVLRLFFCSCVCVKYIFLFAFDNVCLFVCEI